MQVTTNRIRLISKSGGNAVLNHLEGRSVGHVVDARQIRTHQLVDWLLAKMCGGHHQLRYVWTHPFPREGAAEQEIRRYVSMDVFRTAVAWQRREFGCGCGCGGVRGVVGEGHVV